MTPPLPTTRNTNPARGRDQSWQARGRGPGSRDAWAERRPSVNNLGLVQIASQLGVAFDDIAAIHGSTEAGGRSSRARTVTAIFDLLIERVQHANQPVEGEAAIVGVAHAGKVGGGKAGQFGGLSGRQFAVVEPGHDAHREHALGLPDVGVGIAEVPPRHCRCRGPARDRVTLVHSFPSRRQRDRVSQPFSGSCQLRLQPSDPLFDQMNVLLRCGDTLPGLLKSVDHSKLAGELYRVDDATGVRAIPQCDLVDARAEPLHRLGATGDLACAARSRASNIRSCACAGNRVLSPESDHRYLADQRGSTPGTAMPFQSGCGRGMVRHATWREDESWLKAHACWRVRSRW